MKIGTCEADFRHHGGNHYMKLKEYGYTAADRSLSDKQEIFKLSEEERKIELEKERKRALEAGVEISQVHGPWRWPPRDYTPEDRAERMDVMKASIRACSYIGCKNWVIHPIMPMGVQDVGTPDEQKTWEMNKVFMTELLAYAKEWGITICFETMPMPALGIGTPTEILRFVNEMNDDNFKICMDTGHAAVFSHQISVGDAIRQMGDKIACFHIHDCNAKHDLHMLPGTGVIDWDDVCAAIKEIGYKGVFSLESNNAKPDWPEDLYEDYSKLAFDLAKHLVDKIEGGDK